MEVPAQPVYAACALGYEVFSVIDQQPDLPRWGVEVSCGQAWLAQRRSGHRQCVYGVGLAVGAGCVSGMGHQLGRDPHDALARGEHVALEAARQVPAVLHRPGPLGSEAPGPDDQRLVVSRCGATGGATPQPAAQLVHRDDGVCALVRVDSQCDHDHVAFRR